MQQNILNSIRKHLLLIISTEYLSFTYIFLVCISFYSHSLASNFICHSYKMLACTDVYLYDTNYFTVQGKKGQKDILIYLHLLSGKKNMWKKYTIS